MVNCLTLVRESDPFSLIQGPEEVVRFLEQRIEALKRDELGEELIQKIAMYGKNIILIQGNEWKTYSRLDHHVIEYPEFDAGTYYFLIVENDDCKPQIEHSPVNSVRSDPRIIESSLYHELIHIIAKLKHNRSKHLTSEDSHFPNFEEEITTKIENVFRERTGLLSRYEYEATTLEPASYYLDVSSNDIRLALHTYRSKGFMEDYYQLLELLRQRDQSSLKPREPMAC